MVRYVVEALFGQAAGPDWQFVLQMHSHWHERQSSCIGENMTSDRSAYSVRVGMAGAGHASAHRTAGLRAFCRTMPVTQRHTVDRHHLKADLRYRTGWTGLETYGSLVEYLVEAASSGGTGTS